MLLWFLRPLRLPDKAMAADTRGVQIEWGSDASDAACGGARSRAVPVPAHFQRVLLPWVWPAYAPARRLVRASATLPLRAFFGEV
jgi:hypothetical protein